jgi:hypothetical protein
MSPFFTPQNLLVGGGSGYRAVGLVVGHLAVPADVVPVVSSLVVEPSVDVGSVLASEASWRSKISKHSFNISNKFQKF